MPSYTVEFTSTQDMAMRYVAIDPDEWIRNAAHERARIAVEEIVKIAVQRFIDAGQDIPGNKDAIVAAAFANGWVTTAEQQSAAVDAKI